MTTMEEDILADIGLNDVAALNEIDGLIDWSKEQEQSSWWGSFMSNSDQNAKSPDSTGILEPPETVFADSQESAKSLSSNGTNNARSSDGTIDDDPVMSEPDAKRRKL